MQLCIFDLHLSFVIYEHFFFPCNKRISAQEFYKVLKIGFVSTRSVVVRITEGSFSLSLYYSSFVYIDFIFVNTNIFGYGAHMVLCMWGKKEINHSNVIKHVSNHF